MQLVSVNARLPQVRVETRVIEQYRVAPLVVSLGWKQVSGREQLLSVIRVVPFALLVDRLCKLYHHFVSQSGLIRAFELFRAKEAIDARTDVLKCLECFIRLYPCLEMRL